MPTCPSRNTIRTHNHVSDLELRMENVIMSIEAYISQQDEKIMKLTAQNGELHIELLKVYEQN